MKLLSQHNWTYTMYDGLVSANGNTSTTAYWSYWLQANGGSLMAHCHTNYFEFNSRNIWNDNRRLTTLFGVSRTAFVPSQSSYLKDTSCHRKQYANARHPLEIHTHTQCQLIHTECLTWTSQSSPLLNWAHLLMQRDNQIHRLRRVFPATNIKSRLDSN